MSSVSDEAQRIGFTYDDETPTPPVTPVQPPSIPPTGPAPVAMVKPDAVTTPPVTEDAPVLVAAATTSKVKQLTVEARRRRWAVVIIALLLVAGIAYFSKGVNPAGQSVPMAVTPQAAVPADPALDSAAILAEDLARASEYQAANGTFRGFPATAPIVTAAGDSVIVLVFNSSEGCFFTGVAQGFTPEVKNDTSGSNCAPGALEAVQAEIDAADSMIDEASSIAAKTRLESSAEVAQYWASTNYIDGKASFTGFEAFSAGEGVTVTAVENGGASVRLSTLISGGTCLYASVTSSSVDYAEGAC